MQSESESTDSKCLNKNEKSYPFEKEHLKKLNRSSNIMKLHLPLPFTEIINGNSIHGFLNFLIKEIPKGYIYCYFFSDQYNYTTSFSKNQNISSDKEGENILELEVDDDGTLKTPINSNKKNHISSNNSLKSKNKKKKKNLLRRKMTVNSKQSGLSKKQNSMFDKLSDDDTFNEIQSPSYKKIKNRNSKNSFLSKRLLNAKYKSKSKKEKNQKNKTKEVSENPKKVKKFKNIEKNQIKKKRRNYFFKKIFDIEAIYSDREINLTIPFKMNIKNIKLLNTINHNFKVINNSDKKELLVFSISNNLKFLFSTDVNLKNNHDLYKKIIDPNIEFEEKEFFSTSKKLKIIPLDSIKKSEASKSVFKIEKISKSCLKKKIKNFEIEIILDKSHYDLSKDSLSFKINYPNVIQDLFFEIKVRITNLIYCHDIKNIKKERIIYEKNFELIKSNTKKKEILSHYQEIFFEEEEKNNLRSVKTDRLESSYRIFISYKQKSKNKFQIIFDKPLYFIKNYTKTIYSEDKIIKELDKIEGKFLEFKNQYLLPYCEFDI